MTGIKQTADEIMKRVGVFFDTTYSETRKTLYMELITKTGYKFYLVLYEESLKDLNTALEALKHYNVQQQVEFGWNSWAKEWNNDICFANEDIIKTISDVIDLLSNPDKGCILIKTRQQNYINASNRLTTARMILKEEADDIYKGTHLEQRLKTLIAELEDIISESYSEEDRLKNEMEKLKAEFNVKYGYTG